MKEKDNKPSTESMQSLVGEIKQIINDARMRYAVWTSVGYIRSIQMGTHCVHKKQLFMLQQENKDKED